MSRLLFNIAKGFIYGAVVGIFFATAIFLLATPVASLGFLTVSPALLAGLIFAAGVMSGVSYEYAGWLDSTNGGGLLFNIAKGFIYGVTVGLFFGLAVYLLALSVSALGFLTISPVLLAGMIFATGVLSGVGYEYAGWLDKQNSQPQAGSRDTGPPKT